MKLKVSRLVVGLSGVSCGGKTTVTKLLREAFPWSSVLHQDAYFRPSDSKHHIYLSELKHNNWESKAALDFPQMENDLQKLLNRIPNERESYLKGSDKTRFFENDEFVTNHRLDHDHVEQLRKFSNIQLVILEGHIIFHHKPFYKLCNLRYFFTLDEQECRERRRFRVYDPPNPPGFFDKCVWPAYLDRLQAVQKLPGISFVDAKRIPLENIYRSIFSDIVSQLEKFSLEESEFAS